MRGEAVEKTRFGIISALGVGTLQRERPAEREKASDRGEGWGRLEKGGGAFAQGAKGNCAVEKKERESRLVLDGAFVRGGGLLRRAAKMLFPYRNGPSLKKKSHAQRTKSLNSDAHTIAWGGQEGGPTSLSQKTYNHP